MGLFVDFRDKQRTTLSDKSENLRVLREKLEHEISLRISEFEIEGFSDAQLVEQALFMSEGFGEAFLKELGYTNYIKIPESDDRIDPFQEQSLSLYKKTLALYL